MVILWLFEAMDSKIFILHQKQTIYLLSYCAISLFKWMNLCWAPGSSNLLFDIVQTSQSSTNIHYWELFHIISPSLLQLIVNWSQFDKLLPNKLWISFEEDNRLQLSRILDVVPACQSNHLMKNDESAQAGS